MDKIIPFKFNPKQLTISIVSHGHGQIVRMVLVDLQGLIRDGAQVILTLNIKEDEQFLEGLSYQPEIIKNIHAKGFGQNHNDAFARVSRPWFVVMNPDVRLDAKLFEIILATAPAEKMGVISPLIIGMDGRVQASARRYPTVISLVARNILRLCGKKLRPDYVSTNNQCVKVDWLSGCLMIFNSNAYKAVGGFDVRYYMYLEDADICRRLNQKGFDVLLSPHAHVIHDGRHASHSNWRHFSWHLRSIFRFLFI